MDDVDVTRAAGGPAAGSWEESVDRALGRASDAPLREGNRLTLLKNGPETFEEWLEEIGRAEKWVHLELFQFEGGTIGRRFAEAFAQKAREGVHVRVLYDWVGSLLVPRSFWSGLRRAGWRCASSTPRPRRRRCAFSSGTTGSSSPWTAATAPRAG